VGRPTRRAGVVSFVVDEPPTSALDVSARLDAEGIAVRAGNHCCQPLMARLGVAGTVRASFAVYNDENDVERLAAAVRSIVEGAKADRRQAEADEDADYPGPSGASVEAAAAGLLDEFDGLGDWAERYEFLIELGRKAPALPDALRTEDNRVRGCQSTVFLAARVRPSTRDVVEFLADSDSELVRGLLAVLQELFSGRPAAEILAFDLPAFLDEAGLASNLTTGRRNGLAEMIKRLRGFAADVAPA
jgi:cysteine desulfurase/selenocysteine lyase